MDVLAQLKFSDSKTTFHSLLQINSDDAKRILTYRSLIQRLKLDMPEIVSIKAGNFKIHSLGWDFCPKSQLDEIQLEKIGKNGFLVLPKGVLQIGIQKTYDCDLHAERNVFRLTSVEQNSTSDDWVDIQTSDISYAVLADIAYGCQ